MQLYILPITISLLGMVYSHAVERRADVAPQPVPIPQYLPIPAAAKGNKIPASGYYVEEFGGGAYMVTEGLYQAQFYVSDRGVIVIDCPPTIGHKLLYAIGNVTHQPITHMVYSHVHADHIGGAILIVNENVQTIAHTATKSLLEAVNDPNRPLPKQTFHQDYQLIVGNQTLELSYKGENHVQGNIFIYAPKQKVLMLVDVVFPGWTPFSNLGEVKNVPGYIKAHDQILSYDFVHFVGGHLDRSGVREDVTLQQEYIYDLYNNCAYTINLTATANKVLGAESLLPPVLAKNPGNSWAEFDIYLEATAGYCANLTNEKWLQRLAGSDVFQFSNAETMIDSLRLDYGILGAFQLT